MNRMSSLPVARYCPQAPRLGEKYGSGRAALMGSVFHAICAADPEWETMAKMLTDEEMQDIMRWHKPADVDLGDTVLKYSEAEHEFEVALDSVGNHVSSDHEDCVSVGHVDCAWVVETDWQRIAYVLDLKKSEWTVKTSPEDSLQLQAYGIATAQRLNCDAYCVGIWACTEGVYDWGPITDLESDEAKAHFGRVLSAATNFEGEARTGAHCRDCYGREHCPEHLLPAALALESETFKALAEGVGELDNEKALEILLLVQAAEDLLKPVKEQLQEWGRRHGGIVDGSVGKRFAPVEVRGRVGFQSTEFRKDHPELYDQYFKKGAPFVQFRWLNT